jgi:beta-lactamase class A
MEEIGVSFKGAEKSEDFISVKMYSSFFRLLYNSTYLNREMSEKGLEILSTTHFASGIPAGLPKGMMVAHKFGERGLANSQLKQLHDCGIVYFSKSPYLLCVMTRGDDFKKLSDIIKDVSSIVYKNVAEADSI